MTQDIRTKSDLTVGIDIGDSCSSLCTLDAAGNVVDRSTIPTTRASVAKRFEGMPSLRIALEVGPHSRWMSGLLTELGHLVIVANARQVALIYENQKKRDESDAETLARLARLDPTLLSPIQHRSESAQTDLRLLKARNGLVVARTKLVNTVRSMVKSYGERLPTCSATSFGTKALEHVPEPLRPAVHPLIEIIAEITTKIRRIDKDLEWLCENKYPESSRLLQVTGVGSLTALAFQLTIEDPKRFKDPRAVGSYLGLTPSSFESGESCPELRITKAGDAFVRRLLVTSAQYILGPFGPDSDLRRWGQAIAGRGGKNAKKRAVVAVARKLSVLLLKLWITGERYEPLRNSERRARQEAKRGRQKEAKGVG